MVSAGFQTVLPRFPMVSSVFTLQGGFKHGVKNDTKNGYQKTIESVHDLQAKARNQMKTIENQNNHKKTPLRTKLIYYTRDMPISI